MSSEKVETKKFAGNAYLEEIGIPSISSGKITSDLEKISEKEGLFVFKTSIDHSSVMLLAMGPEVDKLIEITKKGVYGTAYDKYVKIDGFKFRDVISIQGGLEIGEES